jgi:hypothetical protein
MALPPPPSLTDDEKARWTLPPPPSEVEDELGDVSDPMPEAEQGTINVDLFAKAVEALTKVAVEGLAGTLHSVRSLRNKELQDCAPKDGLFGLIKAAEMSEEALQDKAVARVVDRLGGTAGDDIRGTLLTLSVVGLPLALLQPLWLRLRRAALIAELYGHAAAQKQGEVVGAAFAVYASGAPLKMAIQTAWKTLCHGSVLRHGSHMTGHDWTRPDMA